MKWLYPLFMVFLLVLTGQSQTNVISVNVGDYGLVPKATMVTLTLISPNPRTYNNILISQVPISITTSSNGIGYFTNIIWGQYRADINANPVTKFLFVVNTNSTGAISLASLVSNPQALPPNPATNYYTQAQIDALLYGVTSGALTNVYATNAAGIFVTNRVAFISTNYASTSITNELATTNYVLAQGFVTASVTNGLATTNYVKAATNGLPSGIWTLGTASQSNSTAFAPSSVTNLTGGQIATIAAAITNGEYSGNAATFTRNNGRLMTISPRDIFLTITSYPSAHAYFQLDSGNPGAGQLDLASSAGSIYLNSRNGSGIFSGDVSASNIVANGTIYANYLGVGNSSPDQNVYKLDVNGTIGNSVGNVQISGAYNQNDVSYSVNINGGFGNQGYGGGSVNIQGGTETAGGPGSGSVNLWGGDGQDSNGGGVYVRGGNVSTDGASAGNVLLIGGTGQSGSSSSSITLNGTTTTSQKGTISVTGDTTFNSALTVNGKALFTNDVILSKGNLYVTNHAYDVSTSQLDPLANEYVTASFVRSVLNNGAFLYGTTNTISVGFSNILTSSTNKVSLQFGANAPSGYTKGFTNFVTGTYPNGPYFASIVSTNTYQSVTGPFVNDFYIQADGSGAGHALGIAPDIFVTYDLTNLIPICAGAEQSLTMAATTNLYTWIQAAAQYNSTNTAGFYIVRRVRVTSQNGTALYINVKGGSGTATTLAFNTPVTVNANYSGTFTGNGSGLTNIASTNITGLGTAAYSNSTAFASSGVTNLTAGQIATIAAAVTNNASPTFTGLSVGAQTALDVNGNGKFGGVGHTNGVITGNGSGVTNVYFTNLTIAKVPLNYMYSLNGGLWNDTGGIIKVGVGYGPAQLGFLSASPFSFGNANGSQIVAAIAVYATNSTSFSINQNNEFMTNSVGVLNQPATRTVTIPSANTVFYYYVTNTIGNITNLQSYNVFPYNAGTTTIFLVGGSCYAFLIP